MKTIISFAPSISRMLDNGGYNQAQLLNACQSAANDVAPEYAGSKRSAFVPKSKGTEIHWNETDKQDYKGKHNSPLAFVSWNDAVARLEKIHGAPSGELTPDCVPAGLRIWIDTKFRKDELEVASSPKVDAARNGKRKVTPEVASK